MSKYKAIIFSSTNNVLSYNYSPGAYRIATELTVNGYSATVIDYFDKWIELPNELFKILNHYIDKDTLLIGFSATFFKQPGSANLISNGFQYLDQSSQLTVWPTTYEKIKCLIASIKQQFPHVKLVYGGKQHIEEYLGSGMLADVDYIIEGLGDSSIIQLAKYLSTHPTANVIKKPQIFSTVLGTSSFDFTTSFTDYSHGAIVSKNETMSLETS